MCFPDINYRMVHSMKTRAVGRKTESIREEGSSKEEGSREKD